MSDKINQIAEDVAVIKSMIMGNGREGLCKVVERHERYFWAVWGCLGVVGFVVPFILKFF
jgi:hypothetical protein